MGNIVVRAGTCKDVDDLKMIGEAAFVELRKIYGPNSKAIENKKCMDEKANILTAEIDSMIVGLVKYDIKDSELSFYSLATHPKYRNRGVARALIAKLEEVAFAHGIEKLSLYTIKQTGNVGVFKKLGFQVVSEIITDLFMSSNGDELIEVKMEKGISIQSD